MIDIPMGRLANKRITLGVAGSIAAFKAAALCSLLKKEGATVRVILTNSACQFIGAATFQGLSGNRVASDMFDRGVAGELHVQLGTESDLLVVAPATADLMARAAQGRADDLLTATMLCARCPILLAPAMHPAMWDHPSTRRNTEQLRSDGRVRLVGPVSGEVATGEIGLGRMAEPEVLLDAVIAALTDQDLRGRHVVVTAGPTVEDLDPIRFLSNRSSGKMGFAIAQRAAQRGARVTLICGPVGLATPPGVERIDIRSALSLQDALGRVLATPAVEEVARSGPDCLVMAAAVGDFRARSVSNRKLKRADSSAPLELEQNPDILAEIGATRRDSSTVLVGFAVETGDDHHLVSCARAKLSAKGVDMVVANDAKDGFGGDDNRAVLVTDSQAIPLERCSKLQLADEILSWILQRWEANR